MGWRWANLVTGMCLQLIQAEKERGKKCMLEGSDRFQIYRRKSPQAQVTDRMWARSVVELPSKENVEG